MNTNTYNSLSGLNTLGVDATCEKLIHATNRQQIVKACLDERLEHTPLLVLGGGSNIVLTCHFQGTVVVLESKGIAIKEDDNAYHLVVEAGENWHDLVKFCLENKMPGLENLALIPGSVGAAPIQNIGAYGAELAQYCEWVEYLDLETGKCQRLNASECLFGYRDSIFKQKLKQRAVILSVALRLDKQWSPNLSYGPLKGFSRESVTPKAVFDCICAIRQQKLPDPKVLGNVGSFFKNPIVSKSQFESLQESYPDIVGYVVSDHDVKLAAGWLIEQAGLKGSSVGGASVHLQQALVLVNKNQATGDDVCQLARNIIAKIHKLFGVTLEVEPRIIGASGQKEIDNA
ncbi:UDP-N-acetylenolpyruvoylglucosamine reductase [Shewanella colwelliana]|uniref:UDP-N-acetylenolpyruvoylglucosamine reductase n=1 Tax=Shewanella colwelliana TaxID=23 RepID=A0A1E5IVI6_SHECO|nr:UDP-N-acetylmuramate dehydrogenase [Shewanella colwelliana]OEG74477.1 UDP-N-acetylenolpyruvoylglucosamine reductase [Shewanella colwelliana]